jgi:predicted transcriptional regulator
MAMTLRLTAEQDAKLDALADELRLSKQQVVTQAIEELAERQLQSEVAKRAFDRVLERDAELLRLLADA